MYLLFKCNRLKWMPEISYCSPIKWLNENPRTNTNSHNDSATTTAYNHVFNRHVNDYFHFGIVFLSLYSYYYIVSSHFYQFVILLFRFLCQFVCAVHLEEVARVWFCSTRVFVCVFVHAFGFNPFPCHWTIINTCTWLCCYCCCHARTPHFILQLHCYYWKICL